MASAARPLIQNRLIPVLRRGMKSPPIGWKYAISMEEQRPDLYPALTFVHLDETSVSYEIVYGYSF